MPPDIQKLIEELRHIGNIVITDPKEVEKFVIRIWGLRQRAADALIAVCAENDRLREAFVGIAAFDDEGANLRLKTTGSYALFDEPGAVQVAREILSQATGKTS